VSLSLTDDTGQVFTQDIEMIVDRRAARRIVYAKRKGRLFEKRDSAKPVVREQATRRVTRGSRPIRVESVDEVVRKVRSILGRRISCEGTSATGRGIAARGRRHFK
jgi:hypothetical protein